MNQVKHGSRLGSEESRALDRFEFGDDRTRIEEIPNAPTALFRVPPRKSRNQIVILGMDGDGQTETRRFAKAVEQSEIVHARKLVEARMTHEGLEADDAARGEFLHVLQTLGCEAAPQREVRDRRRLERRALSLEFPGVHRAR